MHRLTLLVPVLVPALVLAACGDNTHGASPDAAPDHLDGHVAIDAPAVAVDAPGADALQAQVWPAPAAIPLTTPDQTFWGATLTVGGQPFVVDLDTGSTTTGVAGASCTTCKTANVAPLYTPGASSTDQHHPSQTEYADMSGWSGEIFKDVVDVGGGTPNLPLKLVEITKESRFFDPGDDVYQGILGLGPIENSTDAYSDSFIDSAIANGMTAIMAFELCDASGTMWLGGFDATHASAAPAYTPLARIDAQNGFYALSMTSMTIGTTVVGSGAAAFEEPIVDTGTTDFYLPTPIDNAILAAVNASPGWTALFGAQTLTPIENASTNGCVTMTGVTSAMVDAALPPLTMTMPGVTGSPAITLSVAPMASYLQDAGNGQFCYTVGDGGTIGGTIMGDTILRAFVTIIDREHKQVGFAPDSGCNGANELVVRRPIDRATYHPHHPPRPRHPH